MRANPSEFGLVAPATLQDAVALLGREPGTWLPIAGGTDVMVQYAAGALKSRKLISIWGLPELQSIDGAPTEVQIGAGCTYSDIRHHKIILNEFPLLVRSAAWTGGIANQNRGTLGGNIANASPAGDSLPVLLAYDAELILVSARGERRVPYQRFHTDYKKSLLAPDELIRAICLPRKFEGYVPYAKKVGARNAQAISKVFLAGLGRFANGKITDVRLAAGSVAPMPIRLTRTESVLRDQPINAFLLAACRKMLAEEIQPIDDIRSSSQYRTAVLANLLSEFLQSLANGGVSVNAVLSRWNLLRPDEAAGAIHPCCGSQLWAQRMVFARPFQDISALLATADRIWRALSVADWTQAFESHPRIGSSANAQKFPPRSANWSAQEQSLAAEAAVSLKHALAEGNREYERKFGRIFIICATGKSAAEILANLRRRLDNTEAAELQEAAEQQRQITLLRLNKWLTE